MESIKNILGVTRLFELAPWTRDAPLFMEGITDKYDDDDEDDGEGVSDNDDELGERDDNDDLLDGEGLDSAMDMMSLGSASVNESKKLFE